LSKPPTKVNDALEEIALKAADAAIEPDPKQVAGTSNEQVYLPEVNGATGRDQSGRVTAAPAACQPIWATKEEKSTK
jgi:hypothetical protein